MQRHAIEQSIDRMAQGIELRARAYQIGNDIQHRYNHRPWEALEEQERGQHLASQMIDIGMVYRYAERVVGEECPYIEIGMFESTLYEPWNGYFIREGQPRVKADRLQANP